MQTEERTKTESTLAESMVVIVECFNRILTDHNISSLCHVRESFCAMCKIWSVLYARFSLFYLGDSVCVICSLQSAVCAGFGLCHVQFLVSVTCNL